MINFSVLPQPLVLTAHDKLQQVADMPYPFAQESNFLYVTQLREAGWLFILHENTPYLIEPGISEIERIFDGELSRSEVVAITGIDTILDADEGRTLLEKIAKESSFVFSIGEDPHAEHNAFVENPARQRTWEMLAELFTEVRDCRKAMTKLRAIKRDDEVAKLREAVRISMGAFEKVKAELKNVTYEYEIEAVLSAEFRRTGGLGHAYAPIVAGGAHACTLHYVKNSDPLPENGLVLIDAGAHFEGYAADITRTYAVGTPSDREVSVHAAVEKAHHEIIALLKPGLSVKEYHKKVDVIMKNALESLGLRNNASDSRKYFPHAISHGLGLDVHDALGAPEFFAPGMVLTVEPGIYIPEEGIGVRIEDDILITETGHENLSAELPTSL